MDFTPEKSFSSNYKNSQLLLTAAAALPQNGQIAVFNPALIGDVKHLLRWEDTSEDYFKK